MLKAQTTQTDQLPADKPVDENQTNPDRKERKGKGRWVNRKKGTQFEQKRKEIAMSQETDPKSAQSPKDLPPYKKNSWYSALSDPRAPIIVSSDLKPTASTIVRGLGPGSAPMSNTQGPSPAQSPAPAATPSPVPVVTSPSVLKQGGAHLGSEDRRLPSQNGVWKDVSV